MSLFHSKFACVWLTIAAISLSACSRQPAVITFVSDLHTPKVCGFLPNNPQMQVEKLAFLVSDLALKINGNWEKIDFFLGKNHSTNTAIIDLTPLCDDPSIQTKVNLPLALGYHRLVDADAIRLTIGVPFAENHKNPLTQPAPLNEPSMFWSWQRGHKFIRWDMQNEETGKGWMFHLGSVGCQSDSALRAPKQPCSMPNQINLTIEKSTSEGYLFVQTQNWLRNIDLYTSEGCMFKAPLEPDCNAMMQNLQQPWLSWNAQ